MHLTGDYKIEGEFNTLGIDVSLTAVSIILIRKSSVPASCDTVGVHFRFLNIPEHLYIQDMLSLLVVN